MDDRQIEQLENEVRAGIRRDLRSLGVRPYAHYRAGAHERLRPRLRPLRVAGALASGVALVLLAVVLGSALADVRRDAAASPTPGPTATAASPTPEASLVLDARYGIVMVSTEGSSLVIRSETDAQAIATPGIDDPFGTASVTRRLAVSPDGRRLAFWEASEDGGNSLQLWDAARPDRTTTLLTSSSGEAGTRVVWAPDGEGLLLSFVSLGPRPAIGAPPLYAVLRTLDIASGELTEVARAELTNFAPVAWDRERQIGGAVEFGGGGFATAYLVIRDGQASRTSFSDQVVADTVIGSPNARWVLATFGDREIVAWPIDEPERVTELPSDGEGVAPLGWLPGSTRVILREGQGVQESPLFLWDVTTGDRMQIGTTRYTALPRADGTALYVTDERGATSVLDLASGERELVPDMPAYAFPGQVRSEGRPIASVILR
ncbi:MAG: hypothetical protein ACRDGE_04350 [Candidatus Limnocylindria bacterium]